MENKLENLGFEVTLDPLGDSSLFAGLYFLFNVRRRRVIKTAGGGGVIDRPRKGVGVGAHSALVSKVVRFFSFKKINCSKKFGCRGGLGQVRKKNCSSSM